MNNLTTRLTIGILVAFIFSSAYLYRTRDGLGVTPDSVEYIYSASTYMRGDGFKSIHGESEKLPVLTHFPPLTSCFLAWASHDASIQSILDGGRMLQAFMLFLNCLVLFLILYRQTTSLMVSLIATVFVFTICDYTNMYRMIWSEPFFMFFFMLGLLAVSMYAENGKLLSLVAASLFIGLAVITRYAGISLIVTGAFVVLFRKQEKRRKRLMHAALFCMGAGIPLFLWMVRNILSHGNATDRTTGFHPMDISYLTDFLSAVESFFLQLPVSHRGSVISGIGVCLILGVLALVYRKFVVDRLKKEPLLFTLATFSLIYLALIALSNTFFDFTPLYYRIVFPCFICIWIIIVALTRDYLREAGLKAGRLPKRIFYSLVAILFILHLNFYSRYMRNDSLDYGYNSVKWLNSPTVAFIKKLPATAILVSPEPDAVYFTAGRESNSLKVLSRLKFDEKDSVYLVLFSDGRFRMDSAQQKMDLRPLQIFDDGSVYRLTSNASR